MRNWNSLGTALLAISLQGCGGAATESVVNPSRTHSLKESAAITYDARGRGAYIESKDGKLRICAEPPPDAVANNNAESSSSTNANVDALINAMTVKAAFESASSDKAASVIVDVATRTELLLVLRTATYRLCELNINGVLSEKDARAAFDYILRTTRLLGQRDNVAKLIDALQSPELSDELKGEVLKLILAMSWSESVSASTGLADQTAQSQANQILGETFRQLFVPGAAPRSNGGRDNEPDPPPATPVPSPTPRPR